MITFENFEDFKNQVKKALNEIVKEDARSKAEQENKKFVEIIKRMGIPEKETFEYKLKKAFSRDCMHYRIIKLTGEGKTGKEIAELERTSVGAINRSKEEIAEKIRKLKSDVDYNGIKPTPLIIFFYNDLKTYFSD